MVRACPRDSAGKDCSSPFTDREAWPRRWEVTGGGHPAGRLQSWTQLYSDAITCAYLCGRFPSLSVTDFVARGTPPARRLAPHPSAGWAVSISCKISILIPVPTLQTTQLNFSILIMARPQTSVFPDPSSPHTLSNLLANLVGSTYTIYPESKRFSPSFHPTLQPPDFASSQLSGSSSRPHTDRGSL